MAIKRVPFTMKNVIYFQKKGLIKDWEDEMLELRKSVIKSEIYPIGPLIYQVEESESENTYTIYLPVNQKVKMPEDCPYHFMETLSIPDGLSIRHADVEDDIHITCEFLDAFAKSNGLVLGSQFYYIVLPVFGGSVIDIYVPITEDGMVEND
ncbi:DUF5085 family protein [Anaerosporobacter sp.]